MCIAVGYPEHLSMGSNIIIDMYKSLGAELYLTMPRIMIKAYQLIGREESKVEEFLRGRLDRSLMGAIRNIDLELISKGWGPLKVIKFS